MAGKDELSNAVLGGASDYLDDILTKMFKVVFAQGEEKVVIHYIYYVNNLAMYVE